MPSAYSPIEEAAEEGKPKGKPRKPQRPSTDFWPSSDQEVAHGVEIWGPLNKWRQEKLKGKKEPFRLFRCTHSKCDYRARIRKHDKRDGTFEYVVSIGGWLHTNHDYRNSKGTPKEVIQQITPGKFKKYGTAQGFVDGLVKDGVEGMNSEKEQEKARRAWKRAKPSMQGAAEDAKHTTGTWGALKERLRECEFECPILRLHTSPAPTYD